MSSVVPVSACASFFLTPNGIPFWDQSNDHVTLSPNPLHPTESSCDDIAIRCDAAVREGGDTVYAIEMS